MDKTAERSSLKTSWKLQVNIFQKALLWRKSLGVNNVFKKAKIKRIEISKKKHICNELFSENLSRAILGKNSSLHIVYFFRQNSVQKSEKKPLLFLGHGSHLNKRVGIDWEFKDPWK